MKKTKGYIRFITLGVIPAFILYIVFMVIPTISVFVDSLFRTGGLSGKREFIGLQNYVTMFNDNQFIRSFQNTVFLIVIVTIVTMVMAIFFASVFTKENLKGTTFYRIVFYVPNILSIAVVGSVFATVFGSSDGLINGIGNLLSPDNWSNTQFLGDKNLVIYSVAFAMVWQAVGYYMVMYMSTMSQIPASLYEAADLDGAGKLSQFFNITMPLTWETIRTTLTFYIISNINIAFQLVTVLTSGGPNGASMTLLNFQYHEAYTNSAFGYGMAIGVITFLFSFILSAVVHNVTKRDVITY